MVNQPPAASALFQLSHFDDGTHVGENAANNNIVDTTEASIMNMSMLSMDSKETAPTTGETISPSNSDCGTEISSVANLRGWLDGFGKQNKDHYLKNAHIGKPSSDAELEKPLRPKVARRSSAFAPPTPLPPTVASALVKRVILPDTASGTSKKSLEKLPGRKSRNTKIRYSTRPRSPPVGGVQATDDGYATVAQLSKWLADDPTRTKKVKQVRRGANVIAKSRTFDKGLANVIVEQSNLRTGHVVGIKKDWLERVYHPTTSDNSEAADSSVATPTAASDDAASVYSSVSDKKKWLSSAFKTPDVSRKAQTEILTAHDARESRTSRAKQLWRSKRSLVKDSDDGGTVITSSSDSRNPSISCAGDNKSAVAGNIGEPTIAATCETPFTVASASKPVISEKEHIDISSGAKPKCTRTAVKSTISSTGDCSADKDTTGIACTRKPNAVNAGASFVLKRRGDTTRANSSESESTHCTSVSNGRVQWEQSHKAQESKPKEEREGVKMPDESKSLEENKAPEANNASGGFHDARKLLLERSKANGCTIEVMSKVQKRRNRFERLQKDAERRSSTHGLLKPSWRHDDDSDCARNSYIKKYVEDIPEKRSFEELP